MRRQPLAAARRFRHGLLSALLGLPLLFGFAASAQAQATPGLEFSTTHLTWNESQGCGEFEYYGPDGNKITGNTAQQRRRNALDASLPVVGNQLSARGASMELPASAPGPTYRVKLKTKPKVPVKVTVHDPNDLIWWGNNTHRTLNRVLVGPDRGATNGRNGFGKPTLTFTPSNWDQWQPVKVKVACTDHFPDAVPLEHRIESRSITGSGVKYAYPDHKTINDKRWKVWVRVHEETPPVEIVASGLPPAGQTITLEEGATRDFRIRIGERMLPNGSSGRVSVHLFTELPGNVLRATRRDGQPFADGTLHDTMVFTPSSREQWVRLQAVGVGNTKLVVSAERDFTWANSERRHWSPTWPVTVELPGICGRTRAVRIAIVGKIPGVSRCHDVTPEHLAAIVGNDTSNNPNNLNLSRKGLSSLKAGDFDGLTNLKRLRLDQNSLTTLPAGIFDDLAGLSVLDLNNNQLTTLRPGVFDNLTNLRSAYLDNNNLAALPDGVFRNNQKLTLLWLHANSINTLQPGIFDKNTALTELHLHTNSISTLPPGIFDKNTALTELFLRHNQFTALPDGIFDKLTALRYLSLRNNQFMALPDGIFAKLTALTSLWLNNNPGAPFGPTVTDAGPDQTVAPGAQVTLSGSTAAAPWGDNVRLRWFQVDGPASNRLVHNDIISGTGGVWAATHTFTAPSTPGELYFRLAAIPRGYGDNIGIDRGYDWVTITVGAGQNSPQQDALAAQAEEAACVSDALLADVREYAGETWRTSPGHVERWSRVLAAFGESNAYSNHPMTVAEAQAQADRGLPRWTPVAPALQCLAAAPQAQAAPAEVQPATPGTPVTPELSLSAGTAVDEGGPAGFTLTANPAPGSDLTVTYTVAQSGEYLDTPGAGHRTVTLAAGATSTDLSVATLDDAADEADGSVRVTLGTGTGYTVATGTGSAAVTVRDNDEPVISLSAGRGVTEGASASFTVSASPVPATPLDITLTVGQSGDVAVSGETGSRTVTLPVTGSLTVAVATVDDSADEPDGSITATVETGTGYTVAAAPDHAATAAVADNDAAAAGPTISIADATMKENQRTGFFTVTLSEPVDWPVTVRYATRDATPVSAVAGQDYLAWERAWSIWARFRPGETETLIHVRLYNDSHDEEPETFELVLFDAKVNGPPGVSVAIADGVAVGTIENSDPMPKAWLGRFGRTVAQQALDGIASRLAAPRTPGAHGTLAGHAFTLRAPGTNEPAPDDPAPGTSLLAGLAAQLVPALANGGAAAPGGGGEMDTGTPTRFGRDAMDTGVPGPGGPGTGGLDVRALTLQDVLLGSHFSATSQPDAHGGSMAFWGRAAQATFDGREGTFALDGETTTAQLGTDYARDRWLVGVSLLQSQGTGGYDDQDAAPAAACAEVTAAMRALLCDGAVREGAGAVKATLTAAVPYAAFQASERLKLWGAAGYGAGDVTLTPETGGTLTTDIAWTMAQMGLRGTVLAPPETGSGPALAVTSDALWAETTSDQVTGGLAASAADVTRLRLGLEGRWLMALERWGQLTPTLAVGARHDGGEAETGFGVELGGGLAWQAPEVGLALNVEGRTLLTHRDEEFRDQGVAAAFVYDPDPATPRGPSVTLRQDWGGKPPAGSRRCLRRPR